MDQSTIPTAPQPGPLQILAYGFALKITLFCKVLIEKKREYILSKQLLKSATGIGANVEEAQFAQSRPDFISKFSIALKEANESRYWLRLLRDSKYAESTVIEPYSKDVEEIICLLVRSIKTAKGNLP